MTDLPHLWGIFRVWRITIDAFKLITIQEQDDIASVVIKQYDIQDTQIVMAEIEDIFDDDLIVKGGI